MLVDTERSHTLDELMHRLRHAIAWGGEREGATRSSALAPDVFRASPKAVVESVCAARARALGDLWERRHADDPVSLGGGRLLLRYDDASIAAGAIGDLGDGWVDAHGYPAWDAWVGYVVEPNSRAYLVAWIPLAAVGPVTEAAAAAGPGLEWLDEADVGLWRLVERRLLGKD